jgi:CRISPR/Cas system CMR-associated protein Cmr5 small subunit
MENKGKSSKKGIPGSAGKRKNKIGSYTMFQRPKNYLRSAKRIWKHYNHLSFVALKRKDEQSAERLREVAKEQSRLYATKKEVLLPFNEWLRKVA